MSQSKPLTVALARACNVFLLLGAFTLAISFYMGFTIEGRSAFLFIFPGLSAALFIAALLVPLKPSWYRILDTERVNTQSGEESPRYHEAEVPPATPIRVAIPANGAAQLVDSSKKVEVQLTPRSERSATIPLTAHNSITTLMNTTLGDLLLANLIKDPDGAGRLVAQAIEQADALFAAVKVDCANPPTQAVEV